MARKFLNKIDRPFLLSTLILTVAGFFIFTSASLGILSRDQEMFRRIAFNQFVFGFCGGLVALFIMSYVSFKHLEKFAIYIFIFSVILTLGVFVPGIGWGHGGANRWIEILGYNFQPSELLKVAYIIAVAAILTKNREKLDSPRHGLLPFVFISGIVGLILILQPDNDTFIILMSTGLAMFYAAGAKLRYIFLILLIGVLGLGVIVMNRPYVKERIMTYINPQENPFSSGFQIQQSLIAVGSGGVLGKGFGQSTQKFGFLPEPIGDSIFAVASEEFGLLGGVTIIILFIFFCLRGLKIATKTEDDFGRLLVTGLVILIVAGSFFNIAAMVGILPLSGTPLLFISHGGTALLIALAEVGIILNVSKRIKHYSR